MLNLMLCVHCNETTMVRLISAFGDLVELLSDKGPPNFARKHDMEGLRKMHRSVSKKAFAKALQRLVAKIRASGLVPVSSGIRAQVLMPGGTLVNDLLLARRPNFIHVCNAPSPAATRALEIGKAVANQIPELRLSYVY
jgi:L-2-hydroxyglutarate oxidase